MFASQRNRTDFADTRSLGSEPAYSLAGVSRFEISRYENQDAQEALAQCDAADTQLLRLVVCVASVTFTLALVASMA